MSKETKIIIFSALLVFVLSGISIFIGSSMVKIGSVATESKVEKVDLVKLGQDYQVSAKRIVSEYSDSQTVLTSDKVSQLKEQLLALTVPGKFRDLHHNLIFAMDRMADYLKTGDGQAKTVSQNLVSQAKTDYIWLN